MPLGSQRPGPGRKPPDPDALSISDLYRRIDRALRGAVPGEVWVSGEVRSFNVSSRGHCYIDLVDPVSAQDSGTPVLKVVCWSTRWCRVRSTLDQLGITLDTGLVVRVRGEVQLYKPRGDISFILSELDTDALLGKVAAERARLIKALVDENLFDRNRRLAVPRLPLRVGLVASPGTEGYRDFIGCLEASGMAFDVRVVPTQVQGRVAATSVAPGHPPAPVASDCDVLVVVRGGGSKADLATFDAEPVARAIATSDHAGMDRHRPHRRSVGGRRGGQPLLHHPDRVRAGAGPAGRRLLEDRAWRRDWSPARMAREQMAAVRPLARPPAPPDGRPAPAPSSTATRTAWSTGPAPCRAAVRGQVDTHGHRW